MAVVGFIVMPGARRRAHRRAALTARLAELERLTETMEPRWYGPRQVPEYRVPEAARALDVVRPGWHLIVDPATLHLNTSDMCVCGQLANHAVGRRSEFDDDQHMKWNEEWSAISKETQERIGVHSAFSGSCPDDLWLAEIRKRRMAEMEKEQVPEETLATAGD